ncbi:hypothetical protein FE257_004200 [Aspergillus nanangensis]|uniref:Uncharacterized protein n=1 Tax=Aspergillus nanangensis TaxID=2582783 RepID=A0AAD4CRH3_ASPNN|nr:hypothetical protein FE257_004200 [Aspergillus nanangensis]
MGDSVVLPASRSHLESLPVELIQEIFLHCLEFNLPRASAYISRVLSNPMLYKWLIRLAFSSSNESSKRNHFFAGDFLPPQLDFFTFRPSQRRDLQKDILNTRWCTLRLFRKCQREYVQRALNLLSRDLVFSPEDLHTLSTIDQFFDLNPNSHDRGHCGRRSASGDLTLTGLDHNTGTEYHIAVWFHFGAVQVLKHTRVDADHDLFRLPTCSLEAPLPMPDRLLRAPWTEEQLDFLQLLSADTCLDETRSRRVLRQTIKDRDYKAFERLLGLHIRNWLYKYPKRWPVLPNHFQVALKYAENAREDPFLQLLVSQRWDDLSDDELLLKGEVMKQMRVGCT